MTTPRTMAGFDVFVGTWNTSGEVFATAAGPAGTLTATDTYRWLPGRHFLVHDVDARFDGRPTRSTEIIGFDRAKRRHVARSFDDHGATEEFTVALAGRRWTIRGATVRFDGGFDVKKTRLAGLWEQRTGRGRWAPWIDLVLVRA